MCKSAVEWLCDPPCRCVGAKALDTPYGWLARRPDLAGRGVCVCALLVACRVCRASVRRRHTGNGHGLCKSAVEWLCDPPCRCVVAKALDTPYAWLTHRINPGERPGVSRPVRAAPMGSPFYFGTSARRAGDPTLGLTSAARPIQFVFGRTRTYSNSPAAIVPALTTAVIGVSRTVNTIIQISTARNNSGVTGYPHVR